MFRRDAPLRCAPHKQALCSFHTFMNSKIKIATAQTQVKFDPKENGRQIRELMLKASESGADLIHFPEGAVSGYGKSQIKSWGDVDWVMLREELSEIAAVARNLGLWVILGSNHPLTAPNRPHNSMYVISNEGNLHTRYDKQRCSHSEVTDWYTPGQGSVTFEVKGWRFGCALCIEIQFPELFMQYEERDVDCILFSSFSDSQMYRVQAQAHAASNNYWFSFSVPTQCSKHVASSMIGPDGRIIGSCEPLISGITISTLDRDASDWEVPIKRARPWRRLARLGDIYKTIQADDSRSITRNVL